MIRVASVPFSRNTRVLDSNGSRIHYRPVPIALVIRVNEVFQTEMEGTVATMPHWLRATLANVSVARLAIVALSLDESNARVDASEPREYLVPESPRVSALSSDSDVLSAARAAWEELVESGVLLDSEVNTLASAALESSRVAVESAKND